MFKTDCEEQMKKVLCTGVISPRYSTIFLQTQCVLHSFSFCRFVALTHINFYFNIWLPSFISDPALGRVLLLPQVTAGSSSQLISYSHQLLLWLAGCYPAGADVFNFSQCSLNGLTVNGLLVQKPLKRATTDTYQPGEAGNFLKFLRSERQGLYCGDILRSEEIKHLEQTLIFFFIILSSNSHSSNMHLMEKKNHHIPTIP